MTTQVPPQGSEGRSSILPSMSPAGMGFFGSSYSPADAMLTPNQIGVKVGDSIGDVVAGVKGVGFYVDQIGFGAPSTGLTQGMPLKPLGVNYFLKTGVTCSNGAEMWEYIKGIPEGDALGSHVKQAMSDMGLPALRGLAPGMIEDAKHALDPSPLMGALFGSGYPRCELADEMVGDAAGNIRDPATGEPWITDPQTAYRSGDVYRQKKWVIAKNRNGEPDYLSRDEWIAAPKTFHPDGTPKQTEGFEWMTQPTTVIAAGILCVLAMGVLGRR